MTAPLLQRRRRQIHVPVSDVSSPTTSTSFPPSPVHDILSAVEVGRMAHQALDAHREGGRLLSTVAFLSEQRETEKMYASMKAMRAEIAAAKEKSDAALANKREDWAKKVYEATELRKAERRAYCANARRLKKIRKKRRLAVEAEAKRKLKASMERKSAAAARAAFPRSGVGDSKARDDKAAIVASVGAALPAATLPVQRRRAYYEGLFPTSVAGRLLVLFVALTTLGTVFAMDGKTSATSLLFTGMLALGGIGTAGRGTRALLEKTVGNASGAKRSREGGAGEENGEDPKRGREESSDPENALVSHAIDEKRDDVDMETDSLPLPPLPPPPPRLVNTKTGSSRLVGVDDSAALPTLEREYISANAEYDHEEYRTEKFKTAEDDGEVLEMVKVLSLKGVECFKISEAKTKGPVKVGETFLTRSDCEMRETAQHALHGRCHILRKKSSDPNCSTSTK